MAVNGYVHYLIHRTGQAKPVWLLGLSVMDLAGISFSTSLSGGFSSPYFPLYFFVVAMFAWVFSAPRHALAWTTLVVVVYVTLCVSVEPGLDIAGEGGEEACSTGWWRCISSRARCAWSQVSRGAGE